MPVRTPMQDKANARIAGSDRPTPPAVDRQALVEGPLGPRAGSESLMSIPMTGPVHPVNLSTNRGRRWLFLGLLSAVVVTCATWEHVRKSASSLAGLTDVSGPSPRAAESLASGGRSAQDERGSDSGVAVAALNPDRADAGSIESHVALKPVAARKPAPTLTRRSERPPSLVRSRPSKSASFGTGTFATTPARSPSGSESKDN